MTKCRAFDRIYDCEGFWLRAACVCVRDDSESEVLLVSSMAHPDRWIVPGGKVEPDEDPETSAAREAMEEAGVVGNLGRCLGVFENPERKHRTRVYVLHVSQLVDAYEDSGRRDRRWFPIEEATALLFTYKPVHVKYLAAMRNTRPTKGLNNGHCSGSNGCSAFACSSSVSEAGVASVEGDVPAGTKAVKATLE